MTQKEETIWEQEISLSVADGDEKILLGKRATKKYFLENEILQSNSLSQEDRNLLLQAIEEGIEDDFTDFDDVDEKEE